MSQSHTNSICIQEVVGSNPISSTNKPLKTKSNSFNLSTSPNHYAQLAIHYTACIGICGASPVDRLIK
jgi:hypothetical protein